MRSTKELECMRIYCTIIDFTVYEAFDDQDLIAINPCHSTPAMPPESHFQISYAYQIKDYYLQPQKPHTINHQPVTTMCCLRDHTLVNAGTRKHH
jgi:hypothetical protein